MTDPLPFSRPIDIRRIGNHGLSERIVADEGERAALAAAYGILAVGRLEATIRLVTWNRVGVELQGRLVADAVQSCVVTLEGVPEHIEQSFTLTFLPPEAQKVDPKTIAEAEVIVHFDAEDPPDPLVGTVLDLGAIVAEQLALALDPYPRAPGADLARELGDGEDASSSPFAALSWLKRE